MESGDKKEQQYLASRYTFPGSSDRGALAHAFMATNNQDDDNKIIEIKPRQSSKTSSRRTTPRPNQIGKEGQDPATALLDLQLPELLFHDFFLLLTRLEYSYSLEKEVSRSGTRSYTRVRSKKDDQDQGHRSLIYIPEWIITDPNPANLTAIAALGFAFKKGSFLIVFYASSRSPHIQIQQIIQKDWPQYSNYQGCELVSWEQIQQINYSDRETQKILITGILGL